MQTLLLWLARLAGVAGVVVFVLAVAMRLSGQFWIGQVPTATVFQAGVGAMVVACLAYLVRVAEFRS